MTNRTKGYLLGIGFWAICVSAFFLPKDLVLAAITVFVAGCFVAALR
jgi:hypothetical protein